MSNNTRWLDDDETMAWRSLMRAHAALSSSVDRELAAEHDLGLADFEVLSHLCETPDNSLRMTELARGVLLSPSGLTRRLDGLVRQGYVERQPCPSDGRGLLAVLTSKGKEKIEEMAPSHVRAVRRHFVDCLSHEQLQMLGSIFEPLATRIELGDSCEPSHTSAGSSSQAEGHGQATTIDADMRDRQPAGASS